LGVFSAVNIPRQYQLVLLVEEKVRRSEIETINRWEEEKGEIISRVFMQSIGILNFDIKLGRAELIKFDINTGRSYFRVGELHKRHALQCRIRVPN
jgi:hypothetical protein